MGAHSFSELIDLYLKKFAGAQLFTVLKSLTYFEDAETDPMPVMLNPVNWEEVKTVIVSTVNQYLNRKIQIIWDRTTGM